MDYTELNIPTCCEEQAEILTAMLADFPFDSFTRDGGILKAYIPTQKLIDCKATVDAVLREAGIEEMRYIAIETQNWNALWESNFQPVEVDGRCVIRAPFHRPRPGYELDIVIMPRMSFGTGHHETTRLMTAAILDHDLSGMTGLDMGSGTGVLAIAAVKHGAGHVDAVDIDEWAFENSAGNIEANGAAGKITPILGDAAAIRDRHYDFILANINRNILLGDMERYDAALASGGMLMMSGFLEQDVEAIDAKAASLGLTLCGKRTMNGWAALEYTK